MTIARYLKRLDAKLDEMSSVIVSSSILREVDVHLDMGFLKGRIVFLDGSTLDFSEQLPVERAKFRFHYMDAENNLIARWDSAPHHRELSTFPFHVHTPQGVEEHQAITLLEVLEKVGGLISV
ncbi:MAG: hypothetical protein J7M16_00540 [Anaerolineae bacterium]|nr:hypothetical protein [Anaerolineae bacterium]